MQKKQVEKLSEEDFLFGGPSLGDLVKKGGKQQQGGKPSGQATTAAAAQPVEQIQRKTDRMSKADMLQIVLAGL